MGINQAEILKLVTTEWQTTKEIRIRSGKLPLQSQVSCKLLKLLQWGFVERRQRIGESKSMYDWRLKTKD